MPLPLPSEFEDFVSGASRGNALKNLMAQRKYNEAKAEYAPETLLAQAASQAAYANNIAPQYIAKILQDAGFKGTTSDAALEALRQKVQNAGMNGNPLMNTLNQRIMERYGHQQQNQNPLSWLWDKFKNTVHPQQQNMNPMANMGQQPMPRQGGNAFNQPNPFPQATNQQQPSEPAPGSYVDENGNQVNDVTPEQAASLERLNAEGNTPSRPMKLNVNTGQGGKKAPSYLEGEQTYLAGQEQGKELGKAKGKMQGEQGQKLEALSATGGNIDRLIDHFTNPEFVKLRNEFPYLQDMQIEAASHLNNPQIQHMMGQIKTEIESLKASTVQGFGGQPLNREFHLAEQLKPATKDTVYTALGKLETLKALHDIADKKTQLIDQYLKDKNTTPAEAVARANKAVDIKAIDKRVKELTMPATEIENPQTHARMWITLPRARELGFSDKDIKDLGIKK